MKKRKRILMVFMLISTVSFGQTPGAKFKEQTLKSEDIDKTNIKNLFTTYDISPLLTKTVNSVVLGFIGNDYQRIRVKIISVIKNRDNPYQYFVFGKSMVKKNICEFQGTLTVTDAFYIKDPEIKEMKQGLVIGDYSLFENPDQKRTGQFKGVFVLNWYLDKQGQIQYNDLMMDADGFSNNQFAGTWSSYTAAASKPCHWGDYRIPMSDDLDSGAGEFFPSEKYVDNGWQTYLTAYGGSNANAEAARKEELAEWWK